MEYIKRGRRLGVRPQGTSRTYWYTDRKTKKIAERQARTYELNHVSQEETQLNKMTKKDLVEHAQSLGIDPAGKTKKDLIEALGA